MGWVARYTSPDTTATVQLVTRHSTEPWGHRRFLVRAPDGNVINIGYHGG